MLPPNVKSLLALAAGLCVASPSPVHSPRSTTLPLPSHTIFQLNQSSTWFENIAVRANGDLLTTMLMPSASLYTVKEPYSSSPKASLLHIFDDAQGLLGITEISPDTFVVLAGQFSAPSVPVPGSFVAWELSLTVEAPNARTVAAIVNITLPNGAAAVPTCESSVVFITDPMGGAIWRLDTQSGAYEVALNATETQPVAGSDIVLGANGLKYHEGYLYWSNSGLVSIFRVRLDEDGYPAEGAEIEMVGAPDVMFLDDFAVDKSGTVFAASNLDNKLVAIRPDGSSAVVAGAATKLTVAGGTSTAFGRTKADSHALYVATGGALQGPVNGTLTEPAKVVAVDAAGFR